MGFALLFPGQGVQHPQMLPWVDEEPEAKPVLDAMGAMLGHSWRARIREREWATSNVVAQPLLVGLEVAAWKCLAKRLPTPSVVAGYSVGELAAFCAAGLFEPARALSLSRIRALCMDQSVAGSHTGLLAVRHLPLDAISAWCTRHRLSLSIRLGPDQAIVGGLASSLVVAACDPVVAGARMSPIAARIASHTPWMRTAAKGFSEQLTTVCFGKPSTTIVCNFTGAAVRQPAQLAQCLSAQIENTVLWDTSMESVAERGVSCVLEVGPGTTLSNIWRGAYPTIPARSVDEFRSVDAAVDWVFRNLKDH